MMLLWIQGLEVLCVIKSGWVHPRRHFEGQTWGITGWGTGQSKDLFPRTSGAFLLANLFEGLVEFWGAFFLVSMIR